MATKEQHLGAWRVLFMATAPFFSCSCAVDFDLADTDTVHHSGSDTTIPDISLSKSTYKEGEAIVVSYSGLSGDDKDWVGLFKVGAANKDYFAFKYSQGKDEGTMTFEGLTVGGYEARLFFKDSYVLEDKESFTVVR